MAKSCYRTVIDQPADEVWAAVREFNGLATWFRSAASASEIDHWRGFVAGEVFNQPSRVSGSTSRRDEAPRSYSTPGGHRSWPAFP